MAGGLLPSVFRITHARMQTGISFIAGLMLGMALLHMIPHAAEELNSVDRAVAWALGGFLVMFFLQRLFHYHQHGTTDDASAPGPEQTACCGHSQAVTQVGGAQTHAARKLSWLAVAVGLSFHSMIDGLALAAAVSADSRALTGLIGLGTAWRGSGISRIGTGCGSEPRCSRLRAGLLRRRISLHRVQRFASGIALPFA